MHPTKGPSRDHGAIAVSSRTWNRLSCALDQQNPVRLERETPIHPHAAPLRVAIQARSIREPNGLELRLEAARHEDGWEFPSRAEQDSAGQERKIGDSKSCSIRQWHHDPAMAPSSDAFANIAPN